MTQLVSLLQARSEKELWQTLLRRSIRLHLAFGDSTCNQLYVEARLRLIERQLLRYLLPERQQALASVDQAQSFMLQAQEALLTSTVHVAAILGEFSAQQAIDSIHWAA